MNIEDAIFKIGITVAYSGAIVLSFGGLVIGFACAISLIREYLL